MFYWVVGPLPGGTKLSVVVGCRRLSAVVGGCRLSACGSWPGRARGTAGTTATAGTIRGPSSHKNLSESLQTFIFAHMVVTPLSRNAHFRSKVIKSLEKMKAVFSNRCYLQQVMRFWCRMLPMNDVFQQK